MCVSRMFGRPEEKVRIEQIVDGGAATSSRYVFEQYRATFLRCTVLAHTVLRHKRSYVEAIRLLDDFKVAKTKGDGEKARLILASASEDHGHDPDLVPVDVAVSTLDRWIRREIVAVFHERVLVVNETNCSLCDGVPIRDENGFYMFSKSCNKKKPKPCAIEDFWAARSAELARVAASDEVPGNIRDAAAEVVAGSSPRGMTCTAPLSDAVIAAGSPEGSEIATSNLRDFVPLARATGGRRTARNPHYSDP